MPTIRQITSPDSSYTPDSSTPDSSDEGYTFVENDTPQAKKTEYQPDYSTRQQSYDIQKIENPKKNIGDPPPGLVVERN